MMHSLIPIQIFSSASIGLGYNTATEIAQYIKEKTELRYFPLANAGAFTDVIAQEQAAERFGLRPLYARTLGVGKKSSRHLVVLAKDNAARTWLNTQPEAYATEQGAKEALLSSRANVTVFIPHSWLENSESSGVASALNQQCDAVLLWDVRVSPSARVREALSDWCVLPGLPVSYLSDADKMCFEVLCAASKEPGGANRESGMEAGTSFYDPVSYSKTFGQVLASLPASERTMLDIFAECTTTPLSVSSQGDAIVAANDEKLEAHSRAALEVFLQARHIDAASAHEYRQRLERELNLAKEYKVSQDILKTVDVFNACENRMMFVSVYANNSFILHLFGLSLIDPVRYRLHENLFFAKQFNTQGAAINFDCSTLAKDEIDETLRIRYGERYTSALHSAGLGVKSAFRLLKHYPVQAPTKAEIECATERVMFSELAWSSQQLAVTYPDIERFFLSYPWARSMIDGLMGRPAKISGQNATRLLFKLPPQTIAPFFNNDAADKSAPPSIAVPAKDAKWLPAFKFNLQSLRCLDEMNKAILSPSVGVSSLRDIPLNDQSVWLSMRKSNIGLFCMENDGVWKFFVETQISTVDDLATFFALCRPGAIESGLLKCFLTQTPHPIVEAVSEHGALQEILEITRGVPIFHEQFFEIMTRVAGLTACQANYWLENVGELRTEQGTAKLLHDIEQTTTPSLAAELVMLLVNTMPHEFSRGAALFRAMLCYMTGWFRHYHLNVAFCDAVNYALKRGNGVSNREVLKALLDLGADIQGVNLNSINSICSMVVSENVWYPCYSTKKLKAKDLTSS